MPPARSEGALRQGRRGQIRNFTGIDAPYEAPEHPEIHLETLGTRPEELAEQVVRELRRRAIVA